MHKPEIYRNLFNRALVAFPHELKTTFEIQGSFDPDETGVTQYAKGFTFVVGRILTREITVSGKIILGASEHGHCVVATFQTTPWGKGWKWCDPYADEPDGITIEGLYDEKQDVWKLTVLD